MKENLAIEHGLAGVGMWALGDDYGVDGYWETLAATLGLGPPYVPPSPNPGASASLGASPSPGASANPATAAPSVP